MNDVVLRHFLHTVLLVGLSLSCLSQQLGKPIITSYTPDKDYQAGSQNFAAVQDSQGILYLANTSGVLTYDGANWTIIPLSRGAYALSLAIDKNDQIYVAGNAEFGYLKPNHIGQLIYESLTSHLTLSQQQEIDNFWSIRIVNDIVYFQTTKALIRYHQKKVTYLPCQDNISRALDNGQTIFVSTDGEKPLLRLDGNQFVAMPHAEKLDQDIRFLRRNADSTLLLISTKQAVNYHPKSKHIAKINDITVADIPNIFHVTEGKNGLLGIATRQDGAFFISQDRQLHLSEETGLRHNKIFSVNYLQNQNAILGTQFGFALLEMGLPITYWGEHDGLKGTPRDIIRFQNNIAVGTDKGFYHFTAKGHFKEFLKIETWDVQLLSPSLGSTLLIGSSGGIYEFDGSNLAQQICKQGRLLAHSTVYPNHVFTFQKNLILLSKTNNKWVSRAIANIPDLISITIDQQGDLWLGTWKSGVYQIKAPALSKAITGDTLSTADLIHFSAPEKIPLDRIVVQTLNGKVVALTDQGMYQFNASQNTFEPMPAFKHLGSISVIVPDASNNL